MSVLEDVRVTSPPTADDSLGTAAISAVGALEEAESDLLPTGVPVIARFPGSDGDSVGVVEVNAPPDLIAEGSNTRPSFPRKRGA